MPKVTKTKKQKRPLRSKTKRTKLSKLHLLKFLPALAVFGAAALVSTSHSMPARQDSTVLSYATSVDVGGLLSQTNSQRSANGVAALALNSALNSAAQAKANDMVSRNYWSHNTPDGEEPWAFMKRAGYSYKAAGENLAYGFATSADTITGWMNSPPHKENLLKTSFLDVGFGIANSPNYVSNGEETVVVAMYGAQKGASAASNVSSPPASTAKPKTVAKAPAAPVQQAKPVETPAPVPAPVAEPIATQQEVESKSSVPAEANTATAMPMNVRRIQLLTGGHAAWSATLLVSALSCIGLLWAVNRGLHFKRLILSGERFMLHHTHLDLTVVSVITLGWTLLGSGGVIR